MIATAFVLNLVLAVCNDGPCEAQQYFVVDKLQSSVAVDALKDCEDLRDNGNAAYARLNLPAQLHCWTPDELARHMSQPK